MFYVILFLFLFFWFAFWSSQAGRSISSLSDKLDDWQDKKPWYSEIPEAVIALTIGSIAVWGWDKIFDIPVLWGFALFAVFTVIAYAGKQSATWAYLNWEGHTKDSNGDGVIDNKDGRQSTTRGINDWIAARLGYKLGDEGYSWVWAFTKGFMTTFPLVPTGAIFQPLGREAASHAKGRLPFDPNFWMESVGDGFGYSASAFTFIVVILAFFA